MKNLTSLSLLLAITLLLAACDPNTSTKLAMRNINADAEKSGSPFRVEAVAENSRGMALKRTIIGTPGPSAADEVLMRDIATNIKAMENQAKQTEPLKLKEFRQVSAESGKVVEAWVFDRGEETVVYMVSMTQANGGIDFNISGPWE